LREEWEDELNFKLKTSDPRNARSLSIEFASLDCGMRDLRVGVFEKRNCHIYTFSNFTLRICVSAGQPQNANWCRKKDGRG